jgi:hypothetical protein
MCLTKHYAMNTYGEMGVQTNVFLTSTLVGGEWSDSHSDFFNPGVRAHCWGPKSGLDDMEK